MNTDRYPPVGLVSLLMGGVAGIALTVSIALIQSERHGWPFSLHHNVEVTGHEGHSPPPTQAPNAHSPSQSDTRVAIDIDARKAGVLGLKIEPVHREAINEPIRAVATVVPDEARLTHVHTRVAGWLEKLYVNTTGQEVHAGQPLAAVFSQELYASQQEYLSALINSRTGPPSVVAEGAKTRLKLLGMTDAEVAEITRTRQARRLVTLVAPHSGVVLRRSVSAGTAVDPSTEILTVADLSDVWVWAEVPESAANRVSTGATATLVFPALNNLSIESRVDFLYPTLSERTRTLRVRFTIPNPKGDLRPGLFGTANFHNESREALVISRDALVDTGLGQHVFVATDTGRYEPRQVVIGARLPDRLEVIEGLQEGDYVVSSGVFLLDSESRLRASGGAGTGHAGHGQSSQPGAGTREDSPSPATHGEHGGHPQEGG